VAGTPSSRCRFTFASDAVIQVLREAGCELPMMEIHAAVETLLGEAVSRSSVKSYLARRIHRRRPVIEHVAHGRYRLIV